MKLKPLIFGAATIISLTPLALAIGKASAVVDAQTGYLLGGATTKQWRTSKQIAPSLKASQKYRIYSLNRYVGEAVGTKPISEGAPCDETLFVKFPTSTKSPKLVAGTVAIAGQWNAQPRTIHIENTDQPIYRKAVESFLKSQGMTKPTVKITQVLRADLDGDGSSEVLISATNHTGYPNSPGSISAEAKAGNYSFILLRRIVNGKLTTVPLEGEFYPKTKPFSAPNIFSVASVLDVNGDGKMEVVVKSRYYEGDSTIVYSMGRTAVQEVLSEGCGA